jgi:tRNA threonylcarbamoyladenosine biosynthesis protein TsaB
MLCLTIRTDKEEAELGIYHDNTQIADHVWQAHRQLAETIHKEIVALLNGQHKALADIQAIIVYKGPGSFTGLRIGMSVANALADSLDIPVVSTTSESWIKQGLIKLQAGENEVQAFPEYGALPNIALPRK